MPGKIRRFGSYAVDFARREIHGADARLDLPAKVFDCVAYLVEHCDRAVGRDELISAVWGRTDVTDNLLAQTILRARRAFGDDADAQRFIRTIAGFGYRWVPEPDQADETFEAAATVPFPSATVEARRSITDTREPVEGKRAEPTARMRRRLRSDSTLKRFAVIFIILAGLAGLAAYVLSEVLPGREQTRIDASTKNPRSLAFVLPAIVDDAPDFAWARLGVMDFTAQRLREASQATVPSETVVTLAKFKAQSPTQDELATLADATHATFFVTINIRREQNLWRVQFARLSPAGGSTTYESLAGDLLQATARALTQLISSLSLGPAEFDEGVGPAAMLAQQLVASRLQGRLNDARTLIDGASPELRTDPRVRLEVAGIDYFQGREDEARAALIELEGQKHSESPPDFGARVKAALASIENGRHHYAESERLTTEVIDALRGLDLGVAGNALGAALDTRAVARAALGDYDRAADDFGAARTALMTTGNTPWLAVIDVNHATMQMSRDRFTDAAAKLRSASDRLGEFGMTRHQLVALTRLELCNLALQDFDSVAADETKLAELLKLVEDPRARHMGRSVRADAGLALGRIRDASVIVSESLADTSVADNVRSLLLMTQSRIDNERGNASHALAATRDALALHWDEDRAREHALAWLTLVRADRVAEPAKSAQDATAAHSWGNSVSLHPSVKFLLILLDAEQLAARNEETLARDAFERALRGASEHDVPADIVEVTTSYAAWLVGKGDLERAVAVLGRNHEWSTGNFRVAIAEARLYRAIGNQTLLRAAVDRARQAAGERQLPSDISVIETADSTHSEAYSRLVLR